MMNKIARLSFLLMVIPYGLWADSQTESLNRLNLIKSDISEIKRIYSTLLNPEDKEKIRRLEIKIDQNLNQLEQWIRYDKGILNSAQNEKRIKRILQKLNEIGFSSDKKNYIYKLAISETFTVDETIRIMKNIDLGFSSDRKEFIEIIGPRISDKENIDLLLYDYFPSEKDYLKKKLNINTD